MDQHDGFENELSPTPIRMDQQDDSENEVSPTPISMDQHDDAENEVTPLYRASEADSAPRFYRLETNRSTASIFEDVEMAHDEVRADCSARATVIANI